MYQPSFVDTTGFTSGITAGLNKAMEYRMRQDRLFADSMNDLRRSYDTKKMRPGDAPIFLNAFNDHKNALITYTRVNNSNASAEQIYAASQAVDETYSRMNDIFSKSNRGFEKLKQLNSASQTMFRNGIEPVGEFKDVFNKLSNTPLELLADADIDIDPYGFKTMVNADDLKDIDAVILKNIPVSKSSEAVIDASGKPVSFSISVPNVGKAAGKTYNVPYIAEKEKRDPLSVINVIESNFMLAGGEKVKNYASSQLNNLAKSISIDENNPNTTPAQVSEKRMAEAKLGQIKASFPNVKDIKDVLPSQVYAVERGLLNGAIKRFYYDDKEVKTTMAKIAADFGMDMRSQAFSMQMQNAALQATNSANAATMNMLRFALGGGTTIAPGLIEELQNKGITLDLNNLGIINKKKLSSGKKPGSVLELLEALKK